MRYPGSTSFQLGVDLMNRPSFFRLIAFSGSAGYNFQTSPYSRHALTVFKLTYNKLLHTTESFDQDDGREPGDRHELPQPVRAVDQLHLHLRQELRPHTDNRRLYWQNSVTSAGNHPFGRPAGLFGSNASRSTLFGNRFSQFAKEVSEVKFYHRIGRRNNWLATRLLVGVGIRLRQLRSDALQRTVLHRRRQQHPGLHGACRWARAATARPADDRNGYLDQTGDFKLEANVEYRFGHPRDG